MQTVIDVVVRNDDTVHVPAGGVHYLKGGGVHQKMGGAAFNVRTLQLVAAAGPTGLIAANGIVFGGGIELVESAAALPLTGRTLRLTIEDITPEPAP